MKIKDMGLIEWLIALAFFALIVFICDLMIRPERYTKVYVEQQGSLDK